MHLKGFYPHPYSPGATISTGETIPLADLALVTLSVSSTYTARQKGDFKDVSVELLFGRVKNGSCKAYLVLLRDTAWQRAFIKHLA